MNFKPRPAVLLPGGGFLCLWRIGLEGVPLLFQLFLHLLEFVKIPADHMENECAHDGDGDDRAERGHADTRTHGGACEAKNERDCDRNKCHDEPFVSNENFQKLII